MTSEQAYVWFWLPGAVEPVVAGALKRGTWSYVSVVSLTGRIVAISRIGSFPCVLGLVRTYHCRFCDLVESWARQANEEQDVRQTVLTVIFLASTLVVRAQEQVPEVMLSRYLALFAFR
jgi:hypothetical protein